MVSDLVFRLRFWIDDRCRRNKKGRTKKKKRYRDISRNYRTQCHGNNGYPFKSRHNERDGVSNHQRLHCLLNYFQNYDVCQQDIDSLTYWGRDEVSGIIQTTLSNVFSWIKMFEFRIQFDWSLFPRVQLKQYSIGSDNDLVPNRRQAIIWTNDGLSWWRICVSLGLNESMFHVMEHILFFVNSILDVYTFKDIIYI